MTLKQCPHCGGTASLISKRNSRAMGYFVFVRCDVCGAQGKACYSSAPPELEGEGTQACKEALAAWNLRTYED